MQPSDRYSNTPVIAPDEPRAERSPTWFRIPLHDAQATNILLVILIAVFIFEIFYTNGGLSPADGHDLQMEQLGDKVNSLITFKGEYWRLFTAMFLHADILHIGFNGYALLIFGQQIERFYGWPRFLAIYFLSGLLGSIASYAFSPYDSLGASGAIFGLLGAMGAFFFVHRRLLGALARTMLWNAVAIAGLNLVLGLSQSGAVDNFAHGGGLVGGVIVGLLLAPQYRPGKTTGPNERALVDGSPRWQFPTVVMATLAVEVFLFVIALAVQKGAF